MRKHLIPINATLSSLPLALSFKSFGFFKGQMIQQMDTVMAMQKLMGAASEDDFDDIKAMFLETNVYLLMLTGAVSALHSVFDALAFKNEISFWRNRNNMEGLSVRTVFMNVFVNLIVILYLLNNETSMMIIVSNVIGLLIEVDSSSSSHVDVEDHQGRQDPLLLEGKQAGAAYPRSGHLQHQQDQGIRRHRHAPPDGHSLPAGRRLRRVFAHLRDTQVVVRLDHHLAHQLRVSVR